MAKSIQQILSEHNDRLDAIVDEFQDRLQIMVEEAVAKLQKEYAEQLRLSADSRVLQTAKNVRLLSSMDERFREHLNNAGYQKLLENYTRSFDGQFTHFGNIIDFINDNLVRPLPEVNFGTTDLAEFEAAKITAGETLKETINKVASNAKQQALLGVGAMDVDELGKIIQQRMGRGVMESANLAETAVSSYYRMVTDRGFQIIEEDLPSFKIRYTYEGPLDKLNRPFCLKVEQQARNGKTWTRTQINQMDNKQLPNVFVTGGGYRCRHQWIIAVKDLAEQQTSKPDDPKPARRKKDKQDLQKELRVKRTSTKRATALVQRPSLDGLRTAAASARKVLAEKRKANGQ